MFKSVSKARRRQILLLKLGAGVIAGACAAGVLFGLALDRERIRDFHVEVAVQEDGSALVRETITYDFGSADWHGLLRKLPGYGLSEGPEADDRTISEIDVASASAPDQVDVESYQIRVGDPDVEINGEHTYRLNYRLPDAAQAREFAVDVIGTAWEVPIDEAEIDIYLASEPADVRCVQGQEFTDDECSAVQTTADGIHVAAEDLDVGEGVTVYAGLGAGGGSAALPAAQPLPDGDSDWWLWTALLVLGVGAAGYCVALVPVAVWARRAGRDYAYSGAGGAVDAVFGGPDLPGERIDDETADEQVTIQFVPPKDLTPAQGGLVLAERVDDDHRVAWLTQQSMDGWFDIEDDGERLVWTGGDRWSAAPVPVQKIFTKRETVDLEKYDKKFAEAWKLIDDELKQWRKGSGLWDIEAEKRSKRVAGRMTMTGLLGGVAGAIGLYFVAAHSVIAAVLIGGVSAVLVGMGMAAAMNLEELPVRTPAGFAKRQLVAGFLRFFQQSEGRHAREAAERGDLRLYSAWAVALGELTAWQSAMSAAALPPSTPGVSDTASFAGVYSASLVAHTPQSSGSGGSGGFSGGSVGGGAGGGGGGSW